MLLEKAAELLGYKPDSLRAVLRNHPELGEKIGRDWIIPDTSLPILREIKGKVGRPRLQNFENSRP